ncbi:uncharacterized protein LOC135397413 [Ornithodoros turicata]|uniref:uncharacterized protein LOC135397413 n=1 Tax=Ornithodoros turicata TaxID=34597 RepID=UPI0031393B9D
MKTELVTLVASIVYVLVLSACIVRALEKQDDTSDDSFLTEQKRPFCNAFTGCGGKRSGPGRRDLLAQIQNRLLNEARVLEFQRRLSENPSQDREAITDELRSNRLLMDLLAPSSLRKRIPSTIDAE